MDNESPHLLTLFFRQERLFDDVTIAFVGKYTDMQDSYMSVVKSLEHSAFRCSRKLIIKVRLVYLVMRSPTHARIGSG